MTCFSIRSVIFNLFYLFDRLIDDDAEKGGLDYNDAELTQKMLRKHPKNDLKTMQNCLLKIAQKHFEHCTFLDGRIALDYFEFFE